MNLIFHKVPEPEQTDLTEKQVQDKQFILSVARELGVEGLEVKSTACIGRINESGENLLKVEVNNLSVEKQILSKVKLLCQAKDELHNARSLLPRKTATKITKI